MAYVTAASLDFAARHPDEKVRKAHKAFVELMIPVVKGWCTENAVELCSMALQVFGGMGYIEETGIAQQYRDVRIITIYEGTTGIQALDLVGRKLLRDMGAAARTVGKQMEAVAKECAAQFGCNGQTHRRSARQRPRGAQRDLAVDRHECHGRPPQSLRVLGSVPAALGYGRGRLADGARGADRGAKRSPRAIPTPISIELSSRRQLSMRRTCSRSARGTPSRSSTAPATSWRSTRRSSGSTARLVAGVYVIPAAPRLRRPRHHARQSAGQRALVCLLREAARGDRGGRGRRRGSQPSSSPAANGLFSAGADVNDFNAEMPLGAVTIRDVIAAIERSEKVLRRRNRRHVPGRRRRARAGLRLPRRDDALEARAAGDPARLTARRRRQRSAFRG